MEYKGLAEHLKEWNENLISEMCADDVLTCDDLCGCTGDCIVVQGATAITDLLARAEAAEARADEAEASLAAAVRDVEAMAATIRARSIYDTECCFLCKYDGPVEDYCPGWEGEECFRWRGT